MLSKPVWEDAGADEEGKRNLKCRAMEITDEDLVDLIIDNSLALQEKKRLKELALANSEEVAGEEE